MTRTTVGSWYALAVSTGSERKIRERIFDRLEREKIPTEQMTIVCPEEDVVVHAADGKAHAKKRLTLPGYLLLHGRRLDGRTLATIGRVRGVIEFLGPDGKPTPLQKREVDQILGHAGSDNVLPKALFNVGDEATVTSGPFAGFSGTIISVNESQGKAQIEIEIFGRATPAEVPFRHLRAGR